MHATHASVLSIQQQESTNPHILHASCRADTIGPQLSWLFNEPATVSHPSRQSQAASTSADVGSSMLSHIMARLILGSPSGKVRAEGCKMLQAVYLLLPRTAADASTVASQVWHACMYLILRAAAMLSTSFNFWPHIHAPSARN